MANERYAYLCDGAVREIIDPLDGFTVNQRFAPDFVKALVKCGSDVQPGWTYDGKKFAAPKSPTVDLDVGKSNAKAQIASMLDVAASSITAGTPLAEQLSWPVKQEAARAYLAGAATDEQQVILQAEASVTGEDLDTLCKTILASADQFAAAAGMMAGLRRSSTAEIDAAADQNTVAAAVAKVAEALKALAGGGA